MQCLPFAQYPVSHFAQQDWDKIWERPAIDLEPYLEMTHYNNRQAISTFFYPEHEFAGYTYHVIFNPARLKTKIFFRRGTAVNIQGINETDGRYLVDYCQLIRDGIAYLPVHFRDRHKQGFSIVNDPFHYSFILMIPVNLCKSPLLPHLLPEIAIQNTAHATLSHNRSLPAGHLAQESTHQSYELESGSSRYFPEFLSIFC